MEKTFQYRGDLRQTALPEMLAILDQSKMTGTVEAVYGEVTKRIHLDQGFVVFASSTDLADSLGGYLRRIGRLSESEFHSAMQKRGAGGMRLGEVLIEQGILSPALVFQGIREHIEGIVWSLFAWEEGTVTFRVGSSEGLDTVRIQIPLRQVIVQGVRRAANAKSLVNRMGGKSVIFGPAYRFEDLIEVALDADEYRLLARVDGQRTLYELATEGPLSPSDNARLLYAFSVLQLIRGVAVSDSAPTPPGGAIRIKMKSDA